jgi:hypothetical protein
VHDPRSPCEGSGGPCTRHPGRDAPGDARRSSPGMCDEEVVHWVLACPIATGPEDCALLSVKGFRRAGIGKPSPDDAPSRNCGGRRPRRPGRRRWRRRGELVQAANDTGTGHSQVPTASCSAPLSRSSCRDLNEDSHGASRRPSGERAPARALSSCSGR